jgi:hypothetical protein
VLNAHRLPVPRPATVASAALWSVLGAVSAAALLRGGLVAFFAAGAWSGLALSGSI